MSKLISDGYQKLNYELHRREPGFGGHAYRNAPEIARLLPQGTRTLLDYGCGKGTLKPALRKLLPKLKISEYDPAVPGKTKQPAPADVVTCTDVMEHIEPEYVEGVIKHLRSLTRLLLIASVTTQAAQKVLADGRNAHLIVESKEWWLSRFGQHFEASQVFDSNDGFIGLFKPARSPD